MVHVLIMVIKQKISPEPHILISKDYAMDLYSSIRKALDREEKICNQIDELKKDVENLKSVIPEVRDFDFELFKLRFHGNFFVLNGMTDILIQGIYKTTNDSFYINQSYLKSLGKCESELNLKIEMMRIIRNFIYLSENQISKEMIKDFKIRSKHILEG